MFIYLRKRASLRNKPPRQPERYKVSLYAYVRENQRDTSGKTHTVLNEYLGSIKKIGGKLSKKRKAAFYIDVFTKLVTLGFSEIEIENLMAQLDKKIPKPDKKYFHEFKLHRDRFLGYNNKNKEKKHNTP